MDGRYRDCYHCIGGGTWAGTGSDARYTQRTPTARFEMFPGESSSEINWWIEILLGGGTPWRKTTTSSTCRSVCCSVSMSGTCQSINTGRVGSFKKKIKKSKKSNETKTGWWGYEGST